MGREEKAQQELGSGELSYITQGQLIELEPRGR